MAKKAVIIISIVLCVCLVLVGGSVTLAYYYVGTTSASQFSSTDASVTYTKALKSNDGYASIVVPADRDLKILALADTQVTTSDKYVKVGASNEKTYNFVADLVAATKPDMVIILGDLTMTRKNNQWQYLQRYAEIFEEANTLWTFCFGNHDSENGYVEAFSNTSQLEGQMRKSKVIKALSKYPHCLVDPHNSNYVINVKDADGNYIRSLMFFDCEYYDEEAYSPNLTDAQLQWYAKEVDKLTTLAYGSDSNKAIPTSVFMHVCPAEYLKAALEYYKGNIGDDIVYHYGNVVQGISKSKDTFFYSATVNDSDAFQTFLGLQSTDTVYFGHLHDNDMSLTYKGIRLTSVQHSGFSHVYRVIVNDNTLDFRRIIKYGDERGGTMVKVSLNGSITQSQVFGRVVLSNYDTDYAIDYYGYIRQYEANPDYTVIR